MDAIAKLRLELWVLRDIHRESSLHVPFAEDLLEAFLVYVVDFSKSCKVPGILIVVDGDRVALVKDDVARVGVDLLVVARETAWQVGHLLEAAVVVHVERHIALREEFGEGLGRGIFFERRREGGVVHMDLEFHGSLRLGFRLRRMARGIAAGDQKEQRYKDNVSHTHNINNCASNSKYLFAMTHYAFCA